MAKKGKKDKVEVDDVLADLDREIDEDLAEGFDIDDVSGADDPESLVGRRVSWDDEGTTVTGKVIRHNGDEVTLRDDGGDDWEASVNDIEEFLDEDEEPESEEDGEEEPESEEDGEEGPESEEEPESESKKAKTSKKKAKTSKKASTKPEPAPEKDKKTKKKAAKPEPEKTDKKTKKKGATHTADFRVVKLSDVKVPKVKVRDFDPESSRWQTMVKDIKKRGLRLPIEVDDFDSMTLVDGLRRLKAYEKLGYEEIVVFPGGSKTDADRLMDGLLANYAREEMHWTDIASVVTKLCKGADMTQKQVAAALGMREEQISRLLVATKLPEPLVALARGEDAPSAKVFHELAGASPAVVKEVQDALSSGRAVTANDVRALKRASSDSKPSNPKKGTATSNAYTYRDVPRDDLGEAVSIRVHRECLDVKIRIPWKRKTFKGFDLAAELKAVIDEMFADEATSVTDDKTLGKTLQTARAEIV